MTSGSAWPAGTADAVCSTRLPCLCEHGSNTSSDYLTQHGPALTQRATDATRLVYSNLLRTLILAAVLGSLPALLVVVFIEGYYVRWRQRAHVHTRLAAPLAEALS